MRRILRDSPNGAWSSGLVTPPSLGVSVDLFALASLLVLGSARTSAIQDGYVWSEKVMMSTDGLDDVFTSPLPTFTRRRSRSRSGSAGTEARPTRHHDPRPDCGVIAGPECALSQRISCKQAGAPEGRTQQVSGRGGRVGARFRHSGATTL